MIKHLLFGILLSFSIAVSAQKRAVNWNFGANAAISFSRNGVVNVPGSSLNASEGCASISDLSGNLQFYSDGDKVWNADHGLMPNGSNLGSSGTPTQSVIIVPNPKYRHLYYIFTVDQNGGPSGFRYSELDMSLDNGLGNITSNKSISLVSSSAEKLTAIRNSDGTGVWVIAHGINNNNFYSYLVTSNGVQTTPVLSQVGSVHGVQDIGQMKGSPDGKYIAIAAARTGRFVEILDFDAETGSIGSNTVLKVNYSGYYPYGVEFSADALKLYISASTGTGSASIFQYNMNMIVNDVLFRDSEYAVANNVTTKALQLAPDGKIYGARSSNGTSPSPYLDIINSPKLSGSSCNFQSGGLALANGTGSISGLPNFISNYLIERKIEVSDSCIGDNTQFVYLLEIPDSVYWDFDDKSTGVNNHSSILKPTHTFSANGTYHVKLYVFNGTEVDTFNKEVNIHTYPKFSLGNDTTICQGQTLLLRPGILQADYLWQDGRKLSAAAVISTGLYHVRVEKNSCASYDSVFVTVNNPSAHINIQSLEACENINQVELKLNHNDQIKSLTWNMGDSKILKDSIISHTYDQQGTYLISLEMKNEFGCTARDTQSVQILPIAKAAFAPLSPSQCFTGHQVVFAESVSNGKAQLKNYRINTGDGNDFFNSGTTHKYANPGHYKATLYTETNAGCLDTAFAAIDIYKNPDAKFSLIQKDNCEGSDLNEFSAQGQSFNGSLKSSLFMTGDGRLFNVKNINYSYGNPGSYTARYRIIDSLGCMTESTQTIIVDEKPSVDFTVGAGGNCVGTDAIQFSDNSSISSGSITSYAWNFGDSTIASVKNPSHQYVDADRYTVELTVSSDKGCKAKLSKNIFTYEVPQVGFDIDSKSNCLNENRVSFNNNSTIKGTDQLFYEWTIEGVKYLDKSIDNYKFATPGIKTIRLQVRSDKGCESIQTENLEILPSPKASLIMNDPIQCESSNSFIATNTSGSNYNVISWELSDGRSFGGNSINFSSYTVGIIKVELTIENSVACRAKAITFVEVAPNPIADFIAKDVCLNSPMSFDNTSVLNSGSFTKVYWDYGDNHSNTKDFSSVHQFDKPGTYSVYLEVESQAGCRDIIVKKVKVKEIPEVSFDFQKYGYENDKTVFVFQESVNKEYPKYDWYVNSGFSGSGERFFYSFADTGHYNVALVVTNDEGCTSELSKDVFVVPPFQLFFPTAFTPNNDGKNDTYGPEPVEFVSEFDFVILNRWGTALFTTKETFRQWDGTFKGIPAENGSYIYIVKVKDVEGVEYTYQGNFLLLR